MTMTVRKQLSVAAWGASAFCALLLLLSAQAMVNHCVSAVQASTGFSGSPAETLNGAH
jgi:hypothetical protein